MKRGNLKILRKSPSSDPEVLMVTIASNPLRIAVDGLPLVAVHTGIARYLTNLYSHMRGENVSVKYVLPGRLGCEPPRGAMQGGKLNRLLTLPPVAVYALRVAHWIAYERYLTHVVRRGWADIVHESFYTPARFGRRGAVQVFTLHDLSLVRYSHTHSKDRRLFFNRFFASRLPEADHIIVPSEFIRRELSEFASIESRTVTVVPEGVAPCFKPCPADAVQEALEKVNLRSPYLLFVGTTEPRKNLTILLRALSRARADVSLVIAGWSGWGDPAFECELRRLKLTGRVRMVGYVDDSLLAVLYSGAVAFLYPSLYEGFGLPVLEAMACGCPVLASNAGSIPEVAGEAALLADPEDAGKWVEHIERIVHDEALRTRLIDKGIAQAAHFSWTEASRKTLQLFNSLR